MHYRNICKGRFIKRHNRFVAEVDVGGVPTSVHVKNTGRMKELLYEGATVYLEKCEGAQRKTAYDLIAVDKGGLGVVNIDSTAPNRVMGEWLAEQGFENIRAEYTYGNSRFDFYMEKDGEPWLLEVKGCTLEREGVGYFPDAPTQRGVKHLCELTRATGEGYHCALAFVIQMPGITRVMPGI